MTTITITLPRATVEQALEAMRCAVPTGKITLYEWDKAMAALRAALAQQDEPVEPVATHRINSWGFCGVCRHDRIPGEGCARQECPDSPQQAEPVEPVAGVVLNEEGRAALVEHGREEWHCAARNARRLYTTPPQRKPLPKHDQHCVDVPGYGLMAVRLVRAVERALEEEKSRGR